ALVPCRIDQNPPHDLRRDGKKVRAALPPNVLPIDEAQEGLVHERSRLKDVPAPLACHLTSGRAPTLVLHDGQHRLEGLFAAVLPSQEQIRDVRAEGFWHRGLTASEGRLALLPSVSAEQKGEESKARGASRPRTRSIRADFPAAPRDRR